MASLVLPGTGQLIQKQPRGVVYLLAEAIVIGGFGVALSEAHRERDRYRDLAFAVARSEFQPTVRDTVFQYFEAVGEFVSSGAFDLDPGPDLAPPLDPATFNGSIWALARATFFADPNNPPPPGSAAYRMAVDFYVARAVGPNFLWSWQGADSDFEAYRAAIATSDRAFQRSSIFLGVALANHLVSAVDALISSRLRAVGSGGRVETRFGLGHFNEPSVVWTASFSF